MNVFAYLQRAFCLLFSMIIPISASSNTVIGLTEGDPITAERQDYCYDNDRLLIGGYIMEHRDEEHIKYAIDAGLDFVVSSVDENMLNLCDEYGLGVITNGYQNFNAYNPNTINTSPWMNITEDTYNYNHKSVWGHDLRDEPSAELFDGLGKTADNFYKNTTGKIAYINLFPMYASGTQLGITPEISNINKILYAGRDLLNPSVDQYKRYVSDYINKIDTDYISVDIYPLETSNGVKLTRSDWLRNLDILAEACRATNRDLWVITQSTGNTISGGIVRHCDTPEDIRWQAFVTLSFGAKAIIHACYDGGWWDRSSHPIDAQGEKTDTYYAIKTVNGELKSFDDIYGNYVSKGAFLKNKINVAGTLPDAYLTPVETDNIPDVVSKQPLLVGCFDNKDGKGNAYTVVNMNEPENGKSAEVTLKFDSIKKITVYQLGDKTIINSKSVHLSLRNEEGVFITVD